MILNPGKNKGSFIKKKYRKNGIFGQKN